MKSIISAAVRSRRVTLFFAFIFTVVGLFSYHIVPKQENPDVSAPASIITTIYPGASAADINTLVSQKIEDNITDIEGFDHTETTSKKGVSNIIVILDLDADEEKAWDELKDRLNEVKHELPDGCLEPYLNTDLAETAGIIISLSGENYTYEQLGSYADDFKKELSKIDGVSSFDIDGEIEKEVKVTVNMEKLNQYNLSLEDITNVLKSQNIEIPSGSIEYENGKIDVLTPGNFTSLKDIENTIISGSKENGSVIRLGDLANIYMDLDDGAEIFKQDGKNTVLITGYFDEGKNVVLIGKEVRSRLEKIKKRFPEDLIINEVLFQPEDIDESITSFIENLIQSVICVVVVVFIGIGFRNAVVVSMAIPMSMLLTFNMMKLFNIKIHFMSTAGLIIALGMLVDNAIVVSDAIQVNLDDGMDKFDAIVDGTSKSTIPMFTSTLTTIAAFLPLMFIPGAPGQFTGDIPKIVIITLLNSFLIAIVVTPAMAYLTFKPNNKQKVEKRSGLRSFFENLLDLSLRNKKKSLLTVFIVFIISMRLAGATGVQLFPFAEKDFMYIDITSEVSGDMDATEKLVEKVEHILKEQSEVKKSTSSVGNGLPKFYMSLQPSSPSKDFAQMMIRFDLGKKGRFKTKEELAVYLQEEIDTSVSNGTAVVRLLESGAPLGHPVKIRVVGEDYDQIRKDVELIEKELEKIPGTMNIENDGTDKKLVYSIDSNSDLLRKYGLSKYDIQKQINIALEGTKASTYRKLGNEYDIIVESDIKTFKQLENLKIKSTTLGNKILLKQFADVKLGTQLDSIGSYNGDMNILVTCDVKPGYSSIDIENIMEKRIPEINLVNDIVFDGERESIKDSFGDMGILFVLIVVLIYSILIVQFNSFFKPIMILITIPLSLIGCFWGLFIANKPMSFMVMLGIISLAGIVVNNAILLIEYINEARKEGFSIDEACKDAVSKRFRPIILTTTTTVIGLIPLVFSGNALFDSMSVALMSGLLVSTILTMVVIPTMYSLVNKEKGINEEKIKEVAVE